MLADITIEDAIRLLFAGDKPKNMRTDWDAIKNGLSAAGLLHDNRPKRVARWSDIGTVAIVAASKTQDKWHWLIFDAFDGLVYDPLRNAPMHYSRNRRKLVSYLAVKRGYRKTQR